MLIKPFLIKFVKFYINIFNTFDKHILIFLKLKKLEKTQFLIFLQISPYIL